MKTNLFQSRSPAMSYERCSESAKFLLSRTKYRPSVAIICGTGLGTLGDLLSDVDVVPYEDIPHFPLSTGHNHREICGICICFVVIWMEVGTSLRPERTDETNETSSFDDLITRTGFVKYFISPNVRNQRFTQLYSLHLLFKLSL